MKICGLNKTTLLDYPGKVAATVFLGGCNFRCPFCHNSSLVLHENQQPEISQEDVLNFLKKEGGFWTVYASPAENPPCKKLCLIS